MSDIRTASGPRFTRAPEMRELDEEIAHIQSSPGLVERARETVRRTQPARRTRGQRLRLVAAKVQHNLGTLAGLSIFSTALWTQVNPLSGMIATAVSCVLAEWVMH
jgi:hypothetical protein